MIIKKALISVYHKDGIADFARSLIALGADIYASGGTAKHLAAGGIPVTDVADLVGGGPILGHRVVTLSREVHAGLLARDTPEDLAELARREIPRFDLVCVDMYPLREETSKGSASLESVIEMTDIGGPTMLRSAAKGGCIVICDPADRAPVIRLLKEGGLDGAVRESLAAKAEFIVSQYCMTSAIYRGDGKYFGVFGTRLSDCRYGENGWQTPACAFAYPDSGDPLALSRFKMMEGSPMSYNNFCDLDRLLQTMTHIAAVSAKNGRSVPFIAIGAKHGNACGAEAQFGTVHRLENMMAGDPLAIFGGLVMTNFPITSEDAETLSGKMLDGIIAPGFEDEAIAKLRRKGDKCRFIRNEALGQLSADSLDGMARIRHVRGGFLLQPNYTFVLEYKDEHLAKYGPPISTEQWWDLALAWAIGSTSNSNTITLVKDGMLIGNGVGQQDRVGAANLAIGRALRAKHLIRGAVAYSDSFFPFPDAPKALIDAGVNAILTSSGSKNDKETISLCQERGISLLMIPDSAGRGFFGH